MNKQLAKKAMLVDLAISHWTARRIDREVTDEINTKKGAAHDAGRYNKLLIEKHALEPVQAIVSRARNRHLELTQPWLDRGSRILSAKLFVKYMDAMRELRTDFEQEADRFADNYEKHIHARRKSLGAMFDDSDYPSPKEIRFRFSFDVHPSPMPEAEDFRVELSESHAEAMRAAIEESVATATANAMRDAYERIAGTVSHMAAKLRAYRPASGNVKAEGVFRDTLVANVRDLVDLLDGFNLTNDPKLSTLAKRMRDALCKHEPEQLREDEGLRKAVTVVADDIAKKARELLA